MKCELCGKRLSNYGTRTVCDNPKCPLNLEDGPRHTLVAHIMDLVPDRPRPIDTAPHGKRLWLHLNTGETGQGRIRNHNGDFLYWEPSENSLLYDELFDSVLGGAKLQINHVIGWTPVEEEKP